MRQAAPASQLRTPVDLDNYAQRPRPVEQPAAVMEPPSAPPQPARLVLERRTRLEPQPMRLRPAVNDGSIPDLDAPAGQFDVPAFLRRTD